MPLLPRPLPPRLRVLCHSFCLRRGRDPIRRRVRGRSQLFRGTTSVLAWNRRGGTHCRDGGPSRRLYVSPRRRGGRVTNGTKPLLQGRPIRSRSEWGHRDTIYISIHHTVSCFSPSPYKCACTDRNPGEKGSLAPDERHYGAAGALTVKLPPSSLPYRPDRKINRMSQLRLRDRIHVRTFEAFVFAACATLPDRIRTFTARDERICAGMDLIIIILYLFPGSFR